MRSLIALMVLIAINSSSFSQSDNTALLKDMETKLKDHTLELATVLTSKTYASLHPETNFRELVKKHANTTPLAIAPNDEPGKKIKVIATIKDKDGKPVANALVYLYQTDSRGWYAADAPHVTMNEGDFRHARLFGYLKTDKNGKIELHTVKPAGYPQSDLPAHIHVHVSADGFRNLGTEFLFPDDERLKGEILNQAVVNGGMIGVPEKAAAPFEQQFSYTIKLTKQ